MRQVLGKVSKSIAIKNSQAAELQHQNERLKHPTQSTQANAPKKASKTRFKPALQRY
jgi:hypothetical protein